MSNRTTTANTVSALREPTFGYMRVEIKYILFIQLTLHLSLSQDNLFKISDFPITCSLAVCHFQNAGTKKRDLVYYNISPFHGFKLYFILIFTSFLFLPPEERKQCNVSGFVNTKFFCHISYFRRL